MGMFLAAKNEKHNSKTLRKKGIYYLTQEA